MKLKIHSLIAMALAAGAATAYAAVPDGYYDDLEGLSSVTLKNAVKKVAKKNHTSISYGTGSWSVFYESDTRIVGGQLCWWDMYSDNNVAAPAPSKHGSMNIEHGVPNSWWGKTENDAYKDLYHLNPSDAEANNRKGNYPLGRIATGTWDNGVTFVGKPKSGDCGGANYVFEPADEYKGDFAMAYLYMFTTYDDLAWVKSWNWMYDTGSMLTLKPWAYEMLLEWAAADPVSQKEIDRNEVIFKYQKNRNPFIDYPELAEHIWGSKKNQPFHLDGSSTPVDPDPDPDPTDPDDPVTPAPLPEGYWYAVTSTADLLEDTNYILVSTDSGIAMSAHTGGNNNVKYLTPCSGKPKFDTGESPARISEIPADAAVLGLIRDGNAWIISMSDTDGNMQGYLGSTVVKSVTVTADMNAAGTRATITPYADKTDIEFGSVKGTMQYNYNDNGLRFTTYTSNLEPVQLYRLVENNGGSTGIGTGLPENATEVIYGIYDLQGRKVAESGNYGLAPGIYIVISNFGTKKVVLR